MTTYIALLRAVNLAGLNKVGMADLRDLVAGQGFKDPKTLLQSGNVVFSGRARASAALETSLEKAAASQLEVTTAFFIRTAEEWTKIISGNPFPKEAKNDPGRLLVAALKDAPARKSAQALSDAIRGRESVRIKGKTAYLVYPDGVGRSKLTMALIEKKLGTRGTARNWNTVLKLAAAAKA
ncbi:MAG: DUF1697 domain-containing protein [Actinomycetota bacterium]